MAKILKPQYHQIADTGIVSQNVHLVFFLKNNSQPILMILARIITKEFYISDYDPVHRI